MAEPENPYASPSDRSEIRLPLEEAKLPVHPGVTRLLTCCLAMNAASLPLSGLLPEIRKFLEHGYPAIAVDVVNFFAYANVFWMALMWPIVSLTTLIYSASIDRDTRWWLPKSIAAAILLLLWMLAAAFVISSLGRGDMDD